MRRITSIALVFLLVLRGLLGDAMAMGVVPMLHSAHEAQPAVVAMVHGSHEQAAPSGHAEHDAHMRVASHCAEAGQSACSDSQGHTMGCSACGICHTSLFTSVMPDAPGPTEPSVLRAPARTPFFSASTAEVAKPPIS